MAEQKDNEAILRAQWFASDFSWWKRALRSESVWDYPVETLVGTPDDIFKGIELLSASPQGFWELTQKMAESLVSKPAEPPYIDSSIKPAEAEPLDLVELQLQLNAAVRFTPEGIESLLQVLTLHAKTVTFEIIGLGDRIVVQFACDESRRIAARDAILGAMPEASIREERGFLDRAWYSVPAERKTMIHELGLFKDFILPLKTFQDYEADPLDGVIEALSHLNPGEIALFQVMFTKAEPWRTLIGQMLAEEKPISLARAFGDGHRAFAKHKISKPFYAAVIRVAARAETEERAARFLAAIEGATKQRGPAENELYLLSNSALPSIYAEDAHEKHVIARLSQRSGAIYNSEELAAFVHLPGTPKSLLNRKLHLLPRRTKAAPARFVSPDDGNVGSGVLLGINEHRGEKNGVTLRREERTRHTYVVGVSGTGKSTLLFSLILQDLIKGHGCAVLDPHGDLIDKVLDYLPPHRMKDVILFDPSDEEYPVGFNIFSAHSEQEKNLLASDLVAVFKRLSTSWGDQMHAVLGNAILAILESKQGGTLLDLRKFLVDKRFREDFLKSVEDEQVVYYWHKEFPLLKGSPQGSILTRLDAFLRPKLIRNMVAQKDSRLDFAKMMDESKIFLAKLPQGAMGEENSHLLGSFLVAKFHQTALGRQSLSQEKRREFYLYLDEFHNFITPSLASILTGGRKFGLGLILAHQELRQLWNRDAEVASAVLANPSIRACFRLGEWDAGKMAEGFSFFQASDLQSLERGKAICRIDTPGQDFNLESISWEYLLDGQGVLEEKRAAKARELSRQQYGTPRQVVADQLKAETELPIQEDTPHASPSSERVKPARPPRQEPVRGEKRAPREEESANQRQEERVELLPAPELATPGRGGPQHKYLQGLIKKLAEEKGYRADIEKEVLGGGGSVDVALERGEKKIACEISVTTNPDHEIANAQKCLASGYEVVALISPYSKTLNQLRKLASELEEEARKRIQFFLPEEFIAFLDSQEADGAATETMVRGRKVRTTYKALTPEEIKAKKKTIAHTIMTALKRLKG